MFQPRFQPPRRCVGTASAPLIRAYVLNQERHHRENRLSPSLERVTKY
jgi:hypothetical protein